MPAITGTARRAEENTVDKYTRLSVNLSHDTAEALRDLITRKGTSITDGVRRAIAVWKYIDDQRASGARLILKDTDGSEREVVFLEN